MEKWKIKPGISGNVLKWIAVASMVIDHVGAMLLEAFVLNGHGGSPLGNFAGENWEAIYAVDQRLRDVGRLAFPIFCFLLVEGFFHTRDKKKYALRLGMLALISEIPFDLALYIEPFHWQLQNTVFTLLLGFLMIWLIDYYHQSLPALIAGVFGGAALAEILHVDYGAFGVILIIILYLFHDRHILQCVLGAICCLPEDVAAAFAFIFIWLYNGERGRQSKWFFYWFYPVHLLLLFAIGMWVLPAILL